MQNIVQSVKWMMVPAVLGLMLGDASQAASKPLKVSILTGFPRCLRAYLGVTLQDIDDNLGAR